MIKLKKIKSGFTLVELVVAMIVSVTLFVLMGNFNSKYFKNSVEISKIQNDFQEINLGLSALQKIVSERALYFEFNPNIDTGLSCNLYNSSGSCQNKFNFYVDNGGIGETKYYVSLLSCVGSHNLSGKILSYGDGSNTIPLTRCIEGNITHSIEYIDTTLTTKVFRYNLKTDYGIFRQILFSNM